MCTSLAADNCITDESSGRRETRGAREGVAREKVLRGLLESIGATAQ